MDKHTDDKSKKKKSTSSTTKNILSAMLFIIGMVSLVYLGQDLNSKPADICLSSAGYQYTKLFDDIVGKTNSNIKYPNIYAFETRVISEDVKMLSKQDIKKIKDGCLVIVLTESIENVMKLYGRSSLVDQDDAIYSAYEYLNDNGIDTRNKKIIVLIVNETEEGKNMFNVESFKKRIEQMIGHLRYEYEYVDVPLTQNSTEDSTEIIKKLTEKLYKYDL